MTEKWTIETHYTPFDGDEFLVIRSDARPEHVCQIGPLLIAGDRDRATQISALPELLEAAELAVDALEHYVHGDQTLEAVAYYSLFDAIRKAKTSKP